MVIVNIPCLNCKKDTRMTRGQANSLRRYINGKHIVFCSASCQRLFIREKGQKEQEAAVELHSKNTGIDVEDLPR